MQLQLHKAILHTLCYSDIFDFPLTGQEIWKFLITNDQCSMINVQQELEKLVKAKKIKKIGEYYCLPRRGKNIEIRERREKVSEKKIQKAEHVARILSFIPTIQLIALSGSVSMHNAEMDADIDLFFITSSHTLWITRFFVFLFLVILGVKRSRHQKHSANSVCANMFMEEDFLTLPVSLQNLYSAHEFVQLKILVNKKQTCEKLLAANEWIKEYLPQSGKNDQYSMINNQYRWTKLILPLEYLCRVLQLWYMGRHKTRETTEKHLIAFHPTDYAKHILKAYNSRIQKYGI